MNSNIAERENSLKFLGIILNEYLTWKKHIQVIKNKISKNVGALYKTSKLMELRNFNQKLFLCPPQK